MSTLPSRAVLTVLLCSFGLLTGCSSQLEPEQTGVSELAGIPDATCNADSYSQVVDCLAAPEASDPALLFHITISRDIVLERGEVFEVVGKRNLAITSSDPHRPVLISETVARMNEGALGSREYFFVGGATRDFTLASIRMTDYAPPPNNLARDCRAGTHPTNPNLWTPEPCHALIRLTTVRGDRPERIVFEDLDLNSQKALLIHVVGAADFTLRDSLVLNGTVYGLFFNDYLKSERIRIYDNTFAETGTAGVSLSHVDDVWVGSNVFDNNHNDNQYQSCAGPCPGGQLYLGFAGNPITNVVLSGNEISASRPTRTRMELRSR